MATMHFLIPDDVKDKFNEAFEGQNKSAIISKLMVQAVEDEERKRRPLSLVERLRLVRGHTRLAADDEIGRAREEFWI